MRIRKLHDCPEIIAGDKTRLREVLHPDRAYPFEGRYSLAHAVIPPHASSIKHRLRTNEVYYILEGKGVMHINDESAPVESGDTIEIPAGAIQRLVNDNEREITFLCIVDPAWRVEDEEILE